MLYLDDMMSEFGFVEYDGRLPEGSDEYRLAAVLFINELAAALGSQLRAAVFSWPLIIVVKHNPGFEEDFGYVNDVGEVKKAVTSGRLAWVSEGEVEWDKAFQKAIALAEEWGPDSAVYVETFIVYSELESIIEKAKESVKGGKQ